jgi:cellulose biosynthesis protein BcsQ
MQLLERQIRKLVETHQIDRDQQTRLLGIVFGMSRNLFAGRHYQRVMDRIRKEFGANQIFKTSVPMDVSVAKAVDSFRPVVISDPSSAGARAFCQITKELLDRLTPQTALLAKDTKKSVNLSKLE